jgi:DNA repair protein RadC
VVRALWSAADLAFVTAFLFLIDGVGSTSVLGYALAIVASGLWFRTPLVWLSTALSVVSYILLLADARLRERVLQYPSARASAILFVVVLGLIVSYQVNRVRALSRYYEHRHVPEDPGSGLPDAGSPGRLIVRRAVYRSRTKSKGRPQLHEPIDAVEYLRKIWNKGSLELTEDFLMVCLNASHQVLGWVRVSSGGLESTSVDPRVVFPLALQVGASALVLAHNHPSGILEPSFEDRDVTKKLVKSGRLLKISVLDHIILGKESAFSFAKHGLI